MFAERIVKDRYDLQRLPLAHKGMGVVWRARDTLLRRDVVVKFVSPPVDAGLAQRFRREALVTAAFTHPGVPTVIDLGQHEGCPFLVLEWINGITLSDLTQELGEVPTALVYAIGAQISSVLAAAQQIDLVHRDIKPSNVILQPNGAVKVLDFGLAVINDGSFSRITRTGEMMGTLGYMAPEQYHTEQADHRTDLYGLGATLFHLLTGDAPFDDDTTRATFERQVDRPPPRPSLSRRDIPTALDDLVHALLAVRPDDRPSSAVDVYNRFASHVTAVPSLPGFVSDGFDPVRAYAAAVAQQSLALPASPTADGRRPGFDPATADEAERLFAAGEFRAAARIWRKLAEHHRPGPGDDASAFLLRAADAHRALGERDRAQQLIRRARPADGRPAHASPDTSAGR